MIDIPAKHYEREIRDYLLGRLSRGRATGSIPSQPAALPTPPILDWWLFEGKFYRGLKDHLCREWRTVDRQAARLAATFNPHWQDAASPEGDVDWLATAIATATSARPRYVCRTSSAGLSADEASALEGWRNWIGARWRAYVEAVGVPTGAPDTVPWIVQDSGAVDDRRLRRWAFVARRSRWPLLRSVVAETLRALFEPQLVDQLPLPTEPAQLFELVCLVRVLRALQPAPAAIRWLDRAAGENAIRVPGVTCHYQHYIEPKVMLDTREFPPELREAVDRHRVKLPAFVDGLILFDEPRCGFHGVLIEAKSGGQTYDAAVHQLKCYRAALSSAVPGPLIVWGITEEGEVGAWQELERPLIAGRASRDLWLFSPASAISTALVALGLERIVARAA